MFSPLALVAVTLATQATAFLIPPQINDAAIAVEGAWAGLLSDLQYTKELECPGCPFAGSDENDPVWEAGVENRIELTFTIDESQRLDINEAAIYPLDLSHPLQPFPILAQQIRVSDGAKSGPIPLGYALEVYPEAKSEEEPDKAIVGAKFTILDLHGQPVKVDTIKITMLQMETEDGVKLQLIGVDTLPFEETPGADTCQPQSRWSLCRLRAILQSRLSQLIDAAKSHAQSTHKWVKGPGGCKGKKMHYHGHPRHHRHGLHRLMHRFGRMLHRVIRFFVVPALLGVIGGLMASAIGMIVGQLIIYLWIRFRRNSERGPLRHGQVVLLAEEQDELLEEKGGSPPAYQDAVITDTKQ